MPEQNLPQFNANESESDAIRQSLDAVTAATDNDRSPESSGNMPDDGDGLTLRCRGFTGEPEPQTDGDGPVVPGCIVVSGDKPNPLIADGEDGSMIDPGTPDQDEDRKRSVPQGACIPEVTEAAPLPDGGNAPEVGDGTALAIHALIRTFQSHNSQ